MSCLDGTEFIPDMLEGRVSRDTPGIVELRLQGMVPPEPALCIMQILGDEAPEMLIAYLDRNPVNLYDVLEEKGWHAASGQAVDDSFQIVIKRASQ